MNESDRSRRGAARERYSDEEALRYHCRDGKPGKLSVVPTKPMATQRDLSLAYSPGVAAPVRRIADDPDLAYDYTSKGNLVAVITNGSAILGLGDLGALASKPVMEGKAALFKRFADVDAIDLEVDASDPDAFIESVRHLSPSFGGVNLEDIKAPDCFLIEQRLRELMDIPVFHDDQHGTAIIAAAGLINACELSGRKLSEARIVCNGAGAAAIACVELLKAMGVSHDNVIVCDTKGVIHRGRDDLNQWKSAHATNDSARTLAEAVRGADVVLGLSVRGAISADMIASMADAPVVFAMANPDPEILPEEVAAVRDDAYVATGRSDYPNQVNNVLGFPYIFRGALDVRARAINEPMKIAAAEALAELAREDVPDEVAAAYHGNRPRFGAGYLIPAPFDPRLLARIPPAVARAAMDSGVARKAVADLDGYRAELSARLNPIAGFLQGLYERVRAAAKRVAFAEGEEERVIRAAHAFALGGFGEALLVGREEKIAQVCETIGLDLHASVRVVNARLSDRNVDYADHLYRRLQRRGYLPRDCQRLANNDRNVFAACMVVFGDADAMVTGLTRNYSASMENVRLAIDSKRGARTIGMSLILRPERAVCVADASFCEMPDATELADIAEAAAGAARRFGLEPRVALLSFSTFGHPSGDRSEQARAAIEILNSRSPDFEYEGEMAADVALSREGMRNYPFSRLTAPANVLVMPAVHSASISTKMLQQLGDVTVIGPILAGLEKSVQIAPMTATASELVNLAVIAAYDVSV